MADSPAPAVLAVLPLMSAQTVPESAKTDALLDLTERFDGVRERLHPHQPEPVRDGVPGLGAVAGRRQEHQRAKRLPPLRRPPDEVKEDRQRHCDQAGDV